MDEMINMTVPVSCGDEIPVIDAIGEVKEAFVEEPVYKKFFIWKIDWSSKRVSIGYHFMIHTSGGCYYWIRRDTKKQAEYERKHLIYVLNGYKDII
jgi:hypothetical protein